jgi:hypothetical protein
VISGTAPVEGSSEEVAAANLSTFLAAVREQAAREREVRGSGGDVGEPIRDPAADQAGRFGWTVQVNGRAVHILMPGVDVAQLRGLTSEAPCLQIGQEWAWWPDAVYLAVPLPARAGPEPAGQ